MGVSWATAQPASHRRVQSNARTRRRRSEPREPPPALQINGRLVAGGVMTAAVGGGDSARRGRSVPSLGTLQLILTAAGLAAGGLLHFVGPNGGASAIWGATTGLALIVSAAGVVRDLARGKIGVDVVALLALAGSLVVGEFLAGAVIALMLVTGRALEAHASARARRELEALVSRAPAEAHRIDGDVVTTIPSDAVLKGDTLLIAPGEVVPVDGVLVDQSAVLDESALTGEAALTERASGDEVQSGGVNAGAAFAIRATAPAAESTYAGIVRLVREAETSRAPLVRLADRYALWFVPATLIIATVAAVAAHDLVRAVAVLVVATPCPLILAAPVAVVGGMSRAARRGIIVKNGVALETLGRADVVLFDKTGTLTEGRARLARVETHGEADPDEVLQQAASVDQASTHALARALVSAAHQRGIPLTLADNVVEEPGRGVQGTVLGHRIAVGRAAYVGGTGGVPDWGQRVRIASAREGLTNIFVSVDGRLTGVLILDDPIRVDAARAVQRLREAGMQRIVMVTGDHPVVAQGVARAVGMDDVYAESTPAKKLDVVETERRRGTVVMAGDGINDAPALAAADVGVAMGARGATASSEAADVVLMVDRIDRIAEALQIARRSHRIAVQSVVAGMTLSFIAMGMAAFGLLVPVVGAVVQEVIDVAVIVNALRAHGLRPETRPSPAAVTAGQRVLEEHLTLQAGTEQLLTVADELGRVPPAKARSDLDSIRRFLREDLLPHEQAEERSLYPTVAPYAGGEESVMTARREHAEVARLAETLAGMVEGLGPSGPSDDELTALRRVLYSLHAVLRLHRGGEEERLARVVEEPQAVSSARWAPRGRES